MPDLGKITLHFFLQMAIILAVYRLLSPLFRRLRQVEVVAIMVTGFLLGPSLLGLIAPGLQNWLFPQKITVGGASVTHPSLVALYVVGQLGLVVYMFLVGTAFKTEIFAQHIRQAGVVSAAGVLTPIALGGLVGWAMVKMDGTFFTAKVVSWQGALFMAAAIAVTAFPMLAWIVYDTGLLHTRLGTMALACSAVDDTIGWILLATVVAATKGSPAIALLALVGGVSYIVVMVTAGRRLLHHLGRWTEARMTAGDGVPSGALVIAVVVMLGGAWFTDLVGVYSVFGAFIAGVVMPRGRLTEVLRERLEPLTAYVLLPAFFVYSGLNTKLSLVFELTTLIALLIVIVVAAVGKGLSITLAARSQGFAWREAGSLGALMNARGLMELILLNIGLNAGIVTPRLYTILAIVTVATTFAATPLHYWFKGAHPQATVSYPRTPVADGRLVSVTQDD